MEIGDIRGFFDHRHFCSYIGIVPCKYKSGNSDYTEESPKNTINGYVGLSMKQYKKSKFATAIHIARSISKS
jgi:hypothetical protein